MLSVLSKRSVQVKFFVVAVPVMLGFGFSSAFCQNTVPVKRLPGKPQCGSCSITLANSAALKAPESSEPIGYFSYVSRSSRGTVAIVSGNGSKILLFDSTGKFLRDFGKTGDGPGEFRRAVRVEFDSGDSLHVFANRKRLVFDPSLRYIRVTPVPGSIEDATMLSDGSMLIGATVQTADASGLPWHLYRADGTVSRSFGVKGRVNVRPGCKTCETGKHVLGPAAPYVAVAPLNRYSWEFWSTKGDWVASYKVESDWFKEWGEDVNWSNGSVARPPSILAIKRGGDGLLWVRLIRSTGVNSKLIAYFKSGGRSSMADGISALVHGDTTVNRTVLEVVDPNLGVLASQEFKGTLALLSDRFAYRIEENAAGEFVANIYKLTFLRR